jgi:CheY-like chemotaxis protein
VLNGLKVLLVEDNPADARLISEAFRGSGRNVGLARVRDGEEALEYLRGEHGRSLADRPDLVLLDWNLPRRSGSEILTMLKQDETLRPIPVVVLSSSRSEDDVRRAYDLGANCYVSKPMELYEFFRVVEAIELFWAEITLRP